MAVNHPRKSTNAMKVPEKPKKKILRIGIVQNGRIVEERLLKNRGNISIGRGADNTFLIPSKDLPKYFKVFEETRKGYVLNFVKGMDARLAIDGKIFTLNQLLERGDWVQKTSTFSKLDLSVCSRGKLVIGEITVLFHFVDPPKEMPRPQLPHVMWGVYAIQSWLGMIFIAALVGSLFFAGGVAALMNKFYDPNWKMSDAKAKKLRKRFLKRHEVAMKKEIPKEKPSKDGDGKGDAKGDKAAAAKKVAVKSVPSKSSGPVSKANVGEKIANDKALKSIGKLKIDSKALGDLKKVNLGNIPSIKPIGIPNSGIKITTNANIGGINPGSVGTRVSEDGIAGECHGPTCTTVTHAQFKPGQSTSDNAYGSGVTGNGGGGGNGKGGPKGARLPSGISGANIKVNISTNKIKIPMGSIGKIMIAPIKIKTPTISIMSMVPPMTKAPKVSASASGLIPGGAPLGVRKVMGSVKYRVTACFKRAAAKGAVGGGRKTVTVSCKFSNGKFSVSGVSGFTASMFKSCVMGIRKSVKSSDVDGKKFSKSWKFTMHMIAVASN